MMMMMVMVMISGGSSELLRNASASVDACSW